MRSEAGWRAPSECRSWDDVIVELDPTVGHAQRGIRPCITVSNPAVNADQRFPLIAVVPVTGTPGEGALYPQLSPGKSGLTKTSFALIDHVRSVDKRRICRVFGQLAEEELAADEGRFFKIDRALVTNHLVGAARGAREADGGRRRGPAELLRRVAKREVAERLAEVCPTYRLPHTP